MRLKRGVELLGIKPELLIGLFVADSIWKEQGEELVVTSFVDGVHKIRSAHKKGYGADLRTRYFNRATKILISEKLASELKDQFDIVLESDHIHIEYDPVH